MAHMTTKTTNFTAKILVEMYQEMSKRRNLVWQNKATMGYFSHKRNLGGQQFPGACYFNAWDFSHTIDGPISLHKEMDKISQVTFEWPSWLRWLSPCLGPLLVILIVLLGLPILIRLATEAMHSAVASITATIFSLKIRGERILGAQMSFCS